MIEVVYRVVNLQILILTPKAKGEDSKRDHVYDTIHFGLLFSVSSDVLAAYACFLWETEDEEEGDARHDCIQMPILHEQAMKAANA